MEILNSEQKDRKLKRAGARYWYELENEKLQDLGAFIKDGNNKHTAEKAAKRWMRENNVKQAKLIVNSIKTSNLLDIIDIEIQ